MKIAILTCSTHNREWLYNITNPTKQKYCQKFGYTYIFDNSFFPDKTRHPYWNKIKFVAEHLQEFDYVVWMDDDAGFINYDKSLDELFTCEFGHCVDRNGFNSGVFVVKNTQENYDIFNFIWNHMYKQFKNHKFPEQEALNKIYKDLGKKVFDGKLYNAYINGKSEINRKTDKTIILHIAGGIDYKIKNKNMIKKVFTIKNY